MNNELIFDLQNDGSIINEISTENEVIIDNITQDEVIIDLQTGIQGPQGDVGPEGPQGPQGIPGPQGEPFEYEDFTPEQLALLVGPQGEPGPQGDPFVYTDFTPEQLESLRGPEGYTPIKGVDYFDGEDGYTPVKGVDYFDGIDGEAGPQGEPFEYEDFTPEQLALLVGPQGEPGYTPVKGVDYFDGEDGLIMSIVAGTNITVDNTDPANPIINASAEPYSLPTATDTVLGGVKVDNETLYMNDDVLYAPTEEVESQPITGTTITLPNSNGKPLTEYSIDCLSTQASGTASRNLFDASKIANPNIVVSNNGQTILMPLHTSGNGFTSTLTQFKVLCPTIKVGDVIRVRFTRSLGATHNHYIYFEGPGAYNVLSVNNNLTITQAHLDAQLVLYGNRFIEGELTQLTITDFTIMLSSETNLTWEAFRFATPSPDYPSPILSSGDEGAITLTDGTNSTPITLPSGFVGASLPNGVKDTITDTLFTKRVGKVVLNGSESWDAATVTSDANCISFFVLGFKASLNTQINALSDKFPGVTRTNAATILGENIGISNSAALWITVLKSRLTATTAAAFKTWLAANPTTVYYELATPITYPNTVSVPTLSPTTVLTTTNTVKPTITGRYNIASYWTRKFDELLLPKQDTLVSGTSIKTINNTSLLGSGNLSLQTPLTAGTDYLTPTAIAAAYQVKMGNDDNYVTDAEKTLLANTSGVNTGDETTSTIKSKLGITTLSGVNTGDQDLSGKQDLLISGTNIKTINNESLLGSGNIVIEGGSGGAVDSVNGQTGDVVLDADDIDDTSTTHKFVSASDLTKLSNLSGTNTGDQDLSGLLPTAGGTMNGSLLINNNNDVTLTSTNHGLQIGSSDTLNIAIDGNEIQARNNGNANTLNLNAEGGTVTIGVTTPADLTVSGTTTLATTNVSQRIRSSGTFNRGGWNGPTLGALTQIVDNTGAQHSILTGVREDNGARLYGIDLLDNYSAPRMRLYAGSNYIDLAGTLQHNGTPVPRVFIQSGTPTAVQAGDIWVTP